SSRTDSLGIGRPSTWRTSRYASAWGSWPSTCSRPSEGCRPSSRRPFRPLSRARSPRISAAFPRLIRISRSSRPRRSTHPPRPRRKPSGVPPRDARPELFELFGVGFPAYFVLLLTGFLFATAIGAIWARRIGENPDVIVDLGLAMLLAGVAGGRLFHVIADG